MKRRVKLIGQIGYAQIGAATSGETYETSAGVPQCIHRSLIRGIRNIRDAPYDRNDGQKFVLLILGMCHGFSLL